MDMLPRYKVVGGGGRGLAVKKAAATGSANSDSQVPPAPH